MQLYTKIQFLSCIFSMCVLSHFSLVQLFVTLWTVDGQAPLLLGFSSKEYWSELPFPSPGDPPDKIKLGSPALQANSLPSEPPGKPKHSISVSKSLW